MVAHNNQLPNSHFHKRWMDRVKTWFNQPARKQRRRIARKAKVAKLAPRPSGGLLRPVVRPPTVRYNMKTRLGRGFTLEELKEAGINKKVARTVGIAVDHRRKNHSLESLQENVQRLKVYASKLVLFPGKGGKAPSAIIKVADKEELGAVQQVMGDALPLPKPEQPLETRAVEDKDESVYHECRVLRSEQRLEGLRAKRLREKEEEKK
mmetsp:Transcript_19836/g.66723  ORF Transcript_19836/g.66723 Transcript_19836/m.66723 type:complete len:208 (-) Transcript_19836:526-1149(-)